MSNFIDTIYVLKSKYTSGGANDTIYFIPNHEKYKMKDASFLKKVYKNPEILKSVDKKSKIIPYAIESLTVGELKQIVSNILDIPAESLMLSCETEISTQREKNEMNTRHTLFNEPLTTSRILGFSFENEFGKWSKCNPGLELPV